MFTGTKGRYSKIRLCPRLVFEPSHTDYDVMHGPKLLGHVTRFRPSDPWIGRTMGMMFEHKTRRMVVQAILDLNQIQPD